MELYTSAGKFGKGILDDLKALRERFEKVANMRYGNIGVRDLATCLEQQKASCSSKHLILYNLISELGLPVRIHFGLVRLKNFVELYDIDILVDDDCLDYHNFLSVYLSGRWVVIDATFGVHEAVYNLPNNLDWDGKSDQSILFPVEDTWMSKNLYAEKDVLLEALTERQRLKRKSFFSHLSKIMEST